MRTDLQVTTEFTVIHTFVQSTSVRTGRPLIRKHLNTGRGRAKKFVLGLALLLWKLFFQTLKMGDGVRGEEMLSRVSQVEVLFANELKWA